ncbi:MAG: hypothetical protein ABW196_08265 [Solirubrobacterales bacterium]
MSITLNDLLGSFSGNENQPSLLEEVQPGIRYVEESRPGFVEPPLILVHGSLDTATAVVISAPAAVGKTMLAEQIAYKTGGALWDLSRFHVGDHFALGALAKAHGQSQLGETLNRLHRGDFVVVADALDEARLRVGFDAFTAFLDDLASQILKDAVPGRPPIVILARAETAEFASEWLTDSGISVGALSIDFFDRDGANDFVIRQVLAAGQDPESDAMRRAREGLFSQVLGLFDIAPGTPNWPPQARRFIGYAPVLVAISRYLAQGGNPQLIAEQFGAERTPDRMWDLLIALIGDILERDRQKFVEGFRGAVDDSLISRLDFSDWDSLFGPEEQCSWLLNQVLGTAAPASPVPEELETEYRNQLDEWLPQHPFLGNVPATFASPVFEDFVYAGALMQGTDAERTAVRDRVADASYRPTEMLARFLFARSAADDHLQAPDLPALYESLAAAKESGEEMRLQISDSAEAIEASIVIGEESRELRLTSDGSPVVFTRRLSRASIDLNQHTVLLGAPEQPFELGPEVSLRAPEIELASSSLYVRRADFDGGDVVLSASSVVATTPNLPVQGDGLRIWSDADLTYPLVGYRIKEPDEEQELGSEETEAANVLFRVMSFFKSEGYEGIGSYAEPLDRRAANNARFGEVLNFAKARGLITQEKRIYRLHPEVAGLDYLKVRAHVISGETADFLRDFVAQREP